MTPRYFISRSAHRTLLVAQKQVLGVAPGNLTPMLFRLPDGEDRFVPDGLDLNVQLLQSTE
jgi:hypothetical protein